MREVFRAEDCMKHDEIQTKRSDCDEIHEMKFDEIQILFILYLICRKYFEIHPKTH